MTIKTETIPCNFVGSFKVGDNMVFNADLLCKLMDSNANGQFNKLIVVQAGSLVEAALDQIIYRAQNFNLEGVPNISEADRKEIENKKVERFNSIIDVMKKYGILNGLGNDIYSKLHKLRKYRNKVHIQDGIDIEGVSRDEAAAFSDEIRKWSLNLSVKILKYLCETFPRPPELERHVAPLAVPID
jgi:hypothetical protein